MSTPLEHKSSLKEIKNRFDNDVARFSDLETEQSATIDAPLAKEDSPRPVTYQLDLLRKVGFRHTDLLHKNSCFAAFGAIKAD